MKIIKAKRSGLDKIAYICANNINSFLVEENPYNGRLETKIYFTAGKCEIEGDMTEKIADFMQWESDCGILDLVDCQDKPSYFTKKEKANEAK